MTQHDPSALRCLVSMLDIARMTDSGPSTVSNWRTRYADFPNPVTPGRSPRFDLDEMIDWLRSDSSPSDAKRIEFGEHERWAKYAEDAATRFGVPETRGFFAALVLLHLATTTPLRDIPPTPKLWSLTATGDRSTLLTVARQLEADHPVLQNLLVEPLSALDLSPTALGQLCTVVDAAAADPKTGHAELLDLVLALETVAITEQEARTLPELNRLMAMIADPKAGETALDPACGEGGLLRALHEAARKSDDGGDGGGVVVRGQELDEATWRLANTLLLVHGADFDLGRPGLDSLTDDQWNDTRFDIVAVDPPVFDKGSGSHAHRTLDWLHAVRRHLNPSGRAVIMLPAHQIADVPAARRKPDSALHDDLERLAAIGHVEAVLVLPRKLRTDVTGPLTVWSISAEPLPGTGVLVVVVDTEEARRSRASSDRTVALDVTDAAELVKRWRRNLRTEPPDPGDRDDDLDLPGTVEFHTAGAHEILDRIQDELHTIEALSSSRRSDRFRRQDDRAHQHAVHGSPERSQLERDRLRAELEQVRLERDRLRAERAEMIRGAQALLDDLRQLRIEQPERYGGLIEHILALSGHTHLDPERLTFGCPACIKRARPDHPETTYET